MVKRLAVTTFSTVFVLAFIAACSILQEPEEASGPLEAVPLDTSSEVQEPVEGSETIEETTNVAGDGLAETTGGELVVFQIHSDESQVRFELDEDLRGQRKTVVGTTGQVAGEIAVDFSDLSTAQVGIVRVNARTLVTDNNLRNRAIANWILETDDFELITFEPTRISGLPASVSVGETVSFVIVGELTIRDITNEVEFSVEATLVTETQLTGIASAIVSRDDYHLTIPSVPNVANVEEEVELTIDFVANTV